MTERWARFLNEPLLHFAVLGAILFGAYALLREPVSTPVAAPAGADHRVVVTAERVRQLASGWQEMWGHPPSQSELDQLIEDEVRDEVLYREGMAQGMTENDDVIRQHLRDKMLAIAENGADLSEPSEADLRAFYDAHSEDYRVEPLMSFAQIYLDGGREPDVVQQEANELLGRLRAGEVERPWELGDRTELPHELGEYPESDVRLTFGPAFVDNLRSLPRGTWEGPVLSKLGLHLVRIDEWTDARTQPFDEVREDLKGRWIDERVADARERFYAPIRARYTVVVQRPGADVAKSEPTDHGS